MNIRCLLCLCFLGTLFSSNAQVVKVLLSGENSCSGRLEVGIYVRASQFSSLDFKIGSSSVFLNYDPEVVSFLRYTGQEFHDPHSENNSWIEQKATADNECGLMVIVLQLEDNAGANLYLTKQSLIHLGTVKFNVKMEGADPHIFLNKRFSVFSRAETNDGTQKIPLENYPKVLDYNCISDCTDFPVVSNITMSSSSCLSPTGSISLNISDNVNRTGIEFSVDGGFTYPYTFDDSIGVATLKDLSSGTYDLWVRWDNDECPTNLSDVIIPNEEGPIVTYQAFSTCGETSNGKITFTLPKNDALNVTPLAGVAVKDNATGTGYIMYHEQDDSNRIIEYAGSSPNLIAVVHKDGGWYYDNNSRLVSFAPQASDHLIAEVDFDANTVTMLAEEESNVHGIIAGGITNTDLVITPEFYNGSPNPGEFGVSGSLIQIGISSSSTLTIISSKGVTARENASGTGYIMYHEEDLVDRFIKYTGSSPNLIAVVYNNDNWYYDNNAALVSFTPQATDHLIADVDFGENTVHILTDEPTRIHGITAGGITETDLVITPEYYAGVPNPAEFDVTGSYVELRTNSSSPRSIVPSRGIATQDKATGKGYIMYNGQDVSNRILEYTGSSPSLIAVIFKNGGWQYDDNSKYVPFTPQTSDHLIAEVDFGLNTVQMLTDVQTRIHGIKAGGITGTDLVITPEYYAGIPNAGEFGVEGSFVEIEAIFNSLDISIDGGFSFPYSTRYNDSSLDATGLSPGFYNIWARWGNQSCPTCIGTVTVLDDGSLSNEDEPVVTYQGFPSCGDGSHGSISVMFPKKGRLDITPSNGVVARENATGTGYIMYHEDDLSNRFIKYTGSSPNLIPVVYKNGDWYYDNNARLVLFIPQASDHLIAEVDFDENTADMLVGEQSNVYGIAAGGVSATDLVVTPEYYGGVPNPAEFDVTGNFVEIRNSSNSLAIMPTNGIAVRDNAMGTGYIMYNGQDVTNRISEYNGSSPNLIAVVYYEGGGWYYDNNRKLVSFTPQTSDHLIAEVDFEANTSTMLTGDKSRIHGITAGGITVTDLVITPEYYAGVPNVGEFGVTGSFVQIETSSDELAFSLDGGISFPYVAEENRGSLEVTNLSPGDYNIWARRGEASCPIDYGFVVVPAGEACNTCDDGILNGTEEYIDCGGASCIPCDECPFSEVTISDRPIPDNLNLRASFRIESDGMVSSNGYVSLKAANQIELMAGFEVITGGQLLIAIEGCAN